MANSYPYEHLPLPYGYNALEPYINEETLFTHHAQKYQKYVTDLNLILYDNPEYQSWPLTDILIKSYSIPENIRLPLVHNASGVYNHEFYFDLMEPINHQNPSNISIDENQRAIKDRSNYNVYQIITETFLTYDSFKDLFLWYALSVFGSGYAWLVMNPNKTFQFVTTPDEETPLSFGLYPILMIDIWEHAYYLQYIIDRREYVNQWFNIINWEQVQFNYDSALGSINSST